VPGFRRNDGSFPVKSISLRKILKSEKYKEETMEQLFFSGWDTLIRTFVVGVMAYVVLVVLLRVSGKRTLSKMNAFDFIVTVALGSTLATILLNKNVALAEGTLALALLIGLQFVVTWSSVRARVVRQVVTGEPTMLLYRGEYLPAALRKARVTKDEIKAALRTAGFSALGDAEAVVLETDGSLSVVGRSDRDEKSSLEGVQAVS
jgi:uncharacterized membrane protein YcaP (DUF421 family)